MLYNIHTLEWDEELLDLFGIPRSILPKVLPSGGFIGTTDRVYFGGDIPIMGVAGDQQAALFGQMCAEEGTGKNTYGTGCFILMNTGRQAVKSENGLLTTLAAYYTGEASYALEGSIFIGGSVIQWLRDELGMVTSSGESEEWARKVPDTSGVYLVPAFVGLGAPYWNSHTRGAVFGLTRGTNKAHIIRAALESMAYQTADVIRAMEADAGLSLKYLKADGGAAGNGFLMQFQSDILGIPVARAKTGEITALGVAYLAGLGSGFWKGTDEIAQNASEFDTFTPGIDAGKRAELNKGWRRAVEAAMGFKTES
jgi:glycerol kinase